MERCLMRALLMMLDIWAVCSRVPDKPGVKPFWMLCSIRLFADRKENIALQRHDVNTLKGIDSRVIGQK